MQEFSDTLDVSACASDSNRRKLPVAAATAGDRRLTSAAFANGRRKGVPGSGGTAESETADPADTTKSLSLPWTSMLGTVLIAGTVQLLALLLWFIETRSRKSLSELCGFANEPSPDGHETSRKVLPEQNQEERACYISQTSMCAWNEGYVYLLCTCSLPLQLSTVRFFLSRIPVCV